MSAVLNSGVLERLHEINRAYLDFLASDSFRAGCEARPYPPDQTTARLMRLEPAFRARLARCPFTLFNARFHDGTFWTHLTQTNVVHDPAGMFSGENNGQRAATSFSELVFFYAWHLVHSNPSAARIVLGMSDHTLVVFKRLPLTYLQYLSAAHSDLVVLRWPERVTFWQSFLNMVQRGQDERVAEIHSLGIQMIAAELTLR